MAAPIPAELVPQQMNQGLQLPQKEHRNRPWLQRVGEGARDFFLGAPAKQEVFPRFTAPQQQTLNQLLPMLLQSLQGLGQNASFEPIAKQATSKFYSDVVPGLAERFTALGGQRSSDFMGSLGQAGAGLQEGLAALGSQHGLKQQGLNQDMLKALLSLAFQPQFESGYRPSQPGFLQNTLPSVASSLLPLLFL